MRKFLIVEDDPTLQFVLQKILAGPECSLVRAADGTEAIERLRRETFDLIISDLRMEPMDGFALLQALPPSAAHTPFIVITALSDVSSAVRAMEAGAFDYVPKPLNIRALKEVVHRALGMRDRRLLLMIGGEGGRLSEPPLRFGRLVALSPDTMRACDLIEQVACTRAPLVLCGEPGTGRTTLARATHERSGCSGPLLEVAVNGSNQRASGDAETVTAWMTQTRGGTLLLKNVDQMPLGLQQALLDWHLAHLREEESAACPRIISTAETPLGDLVSEGRFLSPLAHWIGLIHVQVEPLRRRREDLTGLCRLFLARESARCGTSFSLDPRALTAIESYTWPGNIHELSAVLSSGSTHASSSGDQICMDHLPAQISGLVSPDDPLSLEQDLRGHSFKGFLRQKEAEHLKRLVDLHDGDLARAAKAASVPLSTLERRWREIQA